MGSIVIAEPPHPPKEKYSLAEPQHPPKVKYFLKTNTTELQGGRYNGDPHTTRYDPQDGLESREIREQRGGKGSEMSKHGAKGANRE